MKVRPLSKNSGKVGEIGYIKGSEGIKERKIGVVITQMSDIDQCLAEILHKHGLSNSVTLAKELDMYICQLYSQLKMQYMYTEMLQRWLLDELNYNDRPRVNIFNKLTNFFIYRGNK